MNSSTIKIGKILTICGVAILAVTAIIIAYDLIFNPGGGANIGGGFLLMIGAPLTSSGIIVWIVGKVLARSER